MDNWGLEETSDGEGMDAAPAPLAVSIKKAGERWGRQHGVEEQRPRPAAAGRSGRQNIVWKNGSPSQVTQERARDGGREGGTREAGKSRHLNLTGRGPRSRHSCMERPGRESESDSGGGRADRIRCKEEMCTRGSFPSSIFRHSDDLCSSGARKQIWEFEDDACEHEVALTNTPLSEE